MKFPTDPMAWLGRQAVEQIRYCQPIGAEHRRILSTEQTLALVELEAAGSVEAAAFLDGEVGRPFSAWPR